MEGVDEPSGPRWRRSSGWSSTTCPRICNHCLNPACVAACPSGAIYKRAEDGVVLVNEDKCRGWRMCVAACPYKKVYYNWTTGKSEKCILCFPRMETGQAPACAHSCVGRIRYMGVLLYDADRIEEVASMPDDELLDAQLDMILDPYDDRVVTAAEAAGIDDGWIDAARRSPVYKFVKEWGLALPLHPEYRTAGDDVLHPAAVAGDEHHRAQPGAPRPPRRATRLRARRGARQGPPARPVPGQPVLRRRRGADPRSVLRKMLAVRSYKRRQSVDGSIDETTASLLTQPGSPRRPAEAIYRLTTMPTIEERFVLPPYHREMSIEALERSAGAQG